MFLVRIVIYLALSGVGTQVAQGSDVERALLKELLASDRYDPALRPVANHSTTITVQMSFIPAVIKELVWTDELLRWDPSSRQGLARMVIPAERLWKPELVIVNSLQRGPDWGFNDDTRLTLYANGTVNWRISFTWHTACQVDLRQFPFDIQTCSIIVAGWNYNSREVTVVPVEEADLAMFREGNNWKLQEVTVSANDIYDLTIFAMKLHMKREPRYFVLNVLVPSVLMSFMTLLIFCLPHQSGEKVSLGVTVLLSFTVLMLSMVDVTPTSGGSIPYLAVYIIVSLVIAGTCVALSIITSVLFNQPGGKPVPRVLRTIVLRQSGAHRSSKVQPSDNDCVKTIREHCQNDEDDLKQLVQTLKIKHQEESEDQKNARDWKLVANKLDNVFFAVIAIVVVSTNIILLCYLKFATPEAPGITLRPE